MNPRNEKALATRTLGTKCKLGHIAPHTVDITDYKPKAIADVRAVQRGEKESTNPIELLDKANSEWNKEHHECKHGGLIQYIVETGEEIARCL